MYQKFKLKILVEKIKIIVNLHKERLTLSIPEQDYLELRMENIAHVLSVIILEFKMKGFRYK